MLIKAVLLVKAQKGGARKFYDEVIAKEGKVAPDAYIDGKTPVSIICKEGHTFVTTPASVKNKHWCNICSKRCPKEAARKYMAILIAKGAQAADPYVKCKDPVRVLCSQGHIWDTTPGSVLEGHWCGACMGRCPKAAAESYYAKVKERGGIPLQEYTNSEEKLLIQCGKGHYFSARPDQVKANHWCKRCNESLGELMTAKCLTELGLSFEREVSLPEAKRRHYDFMTEYKDKKVFIEYDGKFHFEQGAVKSEEEFKQSRWRDIEKTKLILQMPNARIIRLAYPLLDSPNFKEVLQYCLDSPLQLIVTHPDMYTWLTV